MAAAALRGPVGNVVGRITHITDGAGTEDRLYGPLGEIVRETRAIPIQGGPGPDLHHAVHVRHLEPHRADHLSRPADPITHITDGAGTEDRLYGPLGEIVRNQIRSEV